MRRFDRIDVRLSSKRSMALLLRESDVEKLLHMRDTMDLVEKVHRE
jgi:hypothetical protein